MITRWYSSPYSDYWQIVKVIEQPSCEHGHGAYGAAYVTHDEMIACDTPDKIAELKMSKENKAKVNLANLLTKPCSICDKAEVSDE